MKHKVIKVFVNIEEDVLKIVSELSKVFSDSFEQFKESIKKEVIEIDEEDFAEIAIRFFQETLANFVGNILYDSATDGKNKMENFSEIVIEFLAEFDNWITCAFKKHNLTKLN